MNTFFGLNMQNLSNSLSKKKILVIGDSHSAVFSDQAWATSTPRFSWKVVRVEGATVSGLQNPNSKTQAGPIFHKALDDEQADAIVFLLGEVDTGFVIWYRAQKNNVSVKSATNAAIENYKSLILRAKAKAPTFVISTPLPTIRDGAFDGPIAQARSEVKATQHERTTLTLNFNKIVKNICKENAITFIDLDTHSLGKDGLVHPDLLRQNKRDHHYNTYTYQNILKSEFIPSLRDILFKTDSSKKQKMTNNIYLHIGAHKTGTSSIQHFLRENANKLLREAGILYFTPKVWPITLKNGKPDIALNLDAFDELECVTANTIVISHENYSWISSKEDLKKLAEKLQKYAKNVFIVIYLRRQDLLAISQKQEGTKWIDNSVAYGHEPAALPTQLTTYAKFYLDFENKNTN